MFIQTPDFIKEGNLFSIFCEQQLMSVSPDVGAFQLKNNYNNDDDDDKHITHGMPLSV